MFATIADPSLCCRVKTRLQVQVRSKAIVEGPPSANAEPHYNSTWDAISRIVADDGIKGLYAGMNGALLGVASTNFAYFYWYTIVRTLYMKYSKQGAHPSTAVELALGAVAGAVAQLFTIPVAVVTTRQQTANKGERKGLIATAREVIDGPDGISGLWRGLKASLVLVVNPAITYGAYERLKDIFYPGKTNLKPSEAFCEYPNQQLTSRPHLTIPVQCWVPCLRLSRRLLLSRLSWQRLACNQSLHLPGMASLSVALSR